MAKLPRIQRIIQEDFPGRPWLAKLIYPINQFFESIYGALANNLTVAENLNAQIKSITFTSTDVPLKFATTTLSKPTDLVLTKLSRSDSVVTTNAVTVDWSFSDNQITINNITGLTASVTYTARFMIFAEIV